MSLQFSKFLKLEKLSVGVGDRFACQAKAQLRDCKMAASHGAEVIPVWNKSNREHLIIGSEPAITRAAADAAAKELGWAHGALLTTFPDDTTLATRNRCAPLLKAARRGFSVDRYSQVLDGPRSVRKPPISAV